MSKSFGRLRRPARSRQRRQKAFAVCGVLLLLALCLWPADAPTNGRSIAATVAVTMQVDPDLS